jgi:hypothetical protein
LHEIDGGDDSRRYSPQGRPVIRGQDDKSQLTARKILLILDTLIAGEQQVEPRLFGRVKQRAGSSRNRRRLFKGTLGEGKDVMHLLSINRREPFQELVYG